MIVEAPDHIKQIKDILDPKGLALCSRPHPNIEQRMHPNKYSKDNAHGIYPKDSMRMLLIVNKEWFRYGLGNFWEEEKRLLQLCPDHAKYEKPTMKFDNFGVKEFKCLLDQQEDGLYIFKEVLVKPIKVTIKPSSSQLEYIKGRVLS